MRKMRHCQAELIQLYYKDMDVVTKIRALKTIHHLKAIEEGRDCAS